MHLIFLPKSLAARTLGCKILNLDARQLIGTVGTLLLAKQKGLIPSVKVVLDGLIAQGKRISQQLYQEALAIAQE